MKYEQLAANIKGFQAKKTYPNCKHLQLPCLKIQAIWIREFIKMSTLLHNKPTQNIWISALETLLPKKQVVVMDPTNIQKWRDKENITKVKDIPARSGLWLAEQIQAFLQQGLANDRTVLTWWIQMGNHQVKMKRE